MLLVSLQMKVNVDGHYEAIKMTKKYSPYG